MSDGINEQAFLQLLESVLQPNTELVKQATATLQKDYFSKPQSLPVLVHIIANHPEQGVRQIAAVEARRLVNTYWAGSSEKESPVEAQKEDIRNTLLQSAVKEPAAIVKHTTARVISAIARVDLPENKWPSLPTNLSQAATSSSVSDRELGVYILYTLIEAFEDQFSDRWADFFTLFSQTLNDSESLNVRAYTLMALGKMAESFDGDEDTDSIKKFQALLPAMVEVLKQTINSGDEKSLDNVFEVFLNMLSGESALIGKYLKDLIEFMIMLAKNRSNSEDVRRKSLNFLLAVVRIRKMKVQSLKLGERLTSLALEIAAEPESDDDSDDNIPSKIAVLLINFLAESLPPSQVIVPLLSQVGHYVNSQNSDERRAGIAAVGACTDGAPDFVATQIDHIIPVIHRLLQDPEVQVRKATLLTLANLADDLGDEVAKYHKDLVPILINMLDLNDGIDVKRSCCHAIDSLLGEVDSKEMPNYLDLIMPRLSNMFTQDDIALKAAAVGAIASTARGANQQFVQYFEPTLNALKPCLELKEGEEELNLRSVTLDCIGAIAEAVGAKNFTPYVQPIMEAAQESIRLEHSRLKEGAFSFYAIMAKVYKDEFAPFVPNIVESLLESIEQSEAEVDLSQFGEEDGPLVINNVGGSKLSIPISIDDLDALNDGDEEDETWEDLSAITQLSLEKECAIDVVGELVSFCTQAYLPYLEKTIEILISRLQHIYEGVRRSAIDTMFRAYCAIWTMQTNEGKMAKWQPGLPLQIQPPAELAQFGNLIMTRTLALCLDEPDREVVTAIGHNIGEVLKLCGPAILADEKGGIVLENMTQIQLILNKKHPCQLDFEDDEDFEGFEENAEYDWVLLESAFDWLQGFAAAMGPAFAKLWPQFSQIVLKFASSTEHAERSHAVGVTADCIRYMQSGVTEHTSQLLKVLVHRLSDENQEVKSNAAYAVGMLCYYSQDKAEVTKNYGTIFSKLEPLLTTPGHRVLDNACGCVSRMITANTEAVGPLDQVLDTLIGVLPLEEDWEENEPIYEMFIQLYKNQNPVAISKTQKLLPLFQRMVAEAPNEGSLSEELQGQLQELIVYLQSHS